MRILHITPQVEPEVGGIATFTSRLVEGLAARGHQNSIVASHGRLAMPDESVEGTTSIHRVPFYAGIQEREPRAILRCKLRLAAIKRAFRPDIVHLHIGGPVAFLHLATEREAPAPLVVTVYDLPVDAAQGPTVLAVLKNAARVAAISDVRLRDVLRLAPSAAARSRRIYPVLPRAASDDSTVRDTQPLLLTGGRLVPEKGFDVALDALARLREVRPDARLTITGDGPLRSALLDRCHALGLDRAVHLTGRLTPPELAAWRHRAWVTLVPTRSDESFGLVALEAMHAASPVVASRIGGLAEIVADGETGVLVPPGDATALAEAALAIISDEEKMLRMGLAGQARARTFFGWERCLDAYEELFEEARA